MLSSVAQGILHPTRRIWVWHPKTVIRGPPRLLAGRAENTINREGTVLEFKLPYALAMRERAPRMFRGLVRSGQMDAHLQAKSSEAHQLLHDLLARTPKDERGRPLDLNSERMAEEIVLAQMLEFPEDDS